MQISYMLYVIFCYIGGDFCVCLSHSLVEYGDIKYKFGWKEKIMRKSI